MTISSLLGAYRNSHSVILTWTMDEYDSYQNWTCCVPSHFQDSLTTFPLWLRYLLSSIDQTKVRSLTFNFIKLYPFCNSISTIDIPSKKLSNRPFLVFFSLRKPTQFDLQLHFSNVFLTIKNSSTSAMRLQVIKTHSQSGIWHYN